MTSRRVVHISTLHDRNDIRIFEKECISLCQAGWDVHLVTADGNGDELTKQVRIHDIGRKRVSRIARALSDSHAAMKRALSLSPDIIHLHDPELLLSVWYPLAKRIPLVFDIHEDTRTQIALKAYIPRILRKGVATAYGVFENFLCRRMAGLVVPQESMQERFSMVNSKCINLPNFVDLDLYPKHVKSFERPLVFHAGGLSSERGLDNMIGLANSLGGLGEVYVAGNLPSEYSAGVTGELKYLGRLPYAEVLGWYRRANIGVILYNNVGQYHMASAVKSFEYMASSMPFLMPNFGEWLEFNERVGCGLNVDVTDADAVAESVLWLVSNPEEAIRMGNNGREHVEREFSWQSVSGRLLKLYADILQSN